MKRITTFFLACFLVSAIQAQDIITKHFEGYKAQENFMSIHVTGKMFELTTHIEVEEDNKELEEFKEFASTLKSFDMIVGEDMANVSSSYQSALKKLEGSHEELISVKDNDGDYTFFVDESNGIVRELAMIGRASKDLLIFSLTGDMELRQIGKFAKYLNHNKTNPVNKFFERGMDEVKVYPNPVQPESQLYVEAPENMRGGKAILYNMNGVAVKNFSIGEGRRSVSTNGLSAGTYVLEFRKGNVSIKKRVVVR